MKNLLWIAPSLMLMIACQGIDQTPPVACQPPTPTPEVVATPTPTATPFPTPTPSAELKACNDNVVALKLKLSSVCSLAEDDEAKDKCEEYGYK